MAMPILVGALSVLGAIMVDDSILPRMRFGLMPDEHARKVHPWVVRLQSATAGLNEALAQKSTDRTVRGLEDVWFWIGRVVCDALSAGDDPEQGKVVSEAGQAVLEAYQAAGRARQFLVQRHVSTSAYIGPEERMGLLGSGRRAARRIASHVDKIERSPSNEAAWSGLNRELQRYRKKHPLVSWLLPRLNRRLGLQLRPDDVRVYLIPKKAWADMEWLSGAEPGTSRAFFMDGSVYAPKGRAWASLLHELMHQVGLDYDLGLHPYLVEGLADVVTNKVGLPVLERGWRTAYPAQVRYAKELAWRLGFRKPTDFAAWLLQVRHRGGDVLEAVTTELVKRHPQLSKAQLMADLAYGDDRSALDIPQYTYRWMTGQLSQVA
jgi:hypothetical protein